MLTTQSVALIVKKRAEIAGLDADQSSGHGLCNAFATAAANGVEERAIQRTGCDDWACTD